MKVLEQGRAQKGWAKECVCTGHGNGNGGCGAKLLVERDDVYLTHSYHYDGSHEVYYTFQCAGCGVETDIKMSDVPFTPPEKKVWLETHSQG